MPIVTTAHCTKSDADDVAKNINVVLTEEILEVNPGRTHKNFKTIRLNPLWNVRKEKSLDYDLRNSDGRYRSKSTVLSVEDINFSSIMIQC